MRVRRYSQTGANPAPVFSEDSKRLAYKNLRSFLQDPYCKEERLSGVPTPTGVGHRRQALAGAQYRRATLRAGTPVTSKVTHTRSQLYEPSKTESMEPRPYTGCLTSYG